MEFRTVCVLVFVAVAFVIANFVGFVVAAFVVAAVFVASVFIGLVFVVFFFFFVCCLLQACIVRGAGRVLQGAGVVHVLVAGADRPRGGCWRRVLGVHLPSRTLGSWLWRNEVRQPGAHAPICSVMEWHIFAPTPTEDRSVRNEGVSQIRGASAD